MKKKTLGLVALLAMSLTLGACAPSSGPSTPTESTPTTTQRVTRYTVAFEVDGERYRTESVKEGERITANIPNPSKEGFKFIGWFEDGVLVDLETYVVTKDTTFVAQFEEVLAEDILSVDDVKEADKDYYLVLAWWEVSDPEDPTKVTSSLTKDTVRLFYGNLIKYLVATGATEDNIKNIQFRNYSTAKVAELGEKINTDGDVDIVIGCGANIFTQAGALPYNTSDDSKFQTAMGAEAKSRYVALIQGASDLAKTTFDWLNSEVGYRTFLEDVPEDVIAGSLGGDVINLTVNVHGDTVATTVIDDKQDVVTMPTITVPDGKLFDGFAIVEGGEVVLDVAIDAELKYEDLKAYVAEGATSIDLYPVFIDAPVVAEDLIVYVQTGSNLSQAEGELLQERFESTLTDKVVKFNFIEAKADPFKDAVGADADVVIGGNNPVNNMSQHADGPTANAGAHHFANTSRKVIIAAGTQHLDLAKELYNFVIADAPAYEIHATFWTKEYTWVTEAEVATIKEGVTAHINSYFAIAEGETLLDKYNVSISFYEATNTKVAALGEETLALREGKGTDLIIGCGKNVTTTGLVETVAKKIVDPSQIAGNRYVALINDTPWMNSVYTNYFIEAPVVEA